MGTFNIDGMLSAKRTIFYTTDNSTGTTGNLTLRTNGDNDLAPSLVFSIDGVKHSMIKMFSDGHFRFFNSSSSGYRNIYAATFVGNLSGNADTASKLATARTISLTGSVTGSGSFDGSGNLSISTTTNHTHSWSSITSKPSTFTPAAHTHNTLTFGSEGATASVRSADYTSTILTGGWASTSAGYSSQYGTTLDISGYSTWYHRLAFNTTGTIEYWHGINTKTMSKIGNLITSANIGSQSVNYANSAGVLATARSIFGQSFNGSGDVQGRGTFYGPYGDPRAIVIREADLSTTGHNSNSAAPTLNFWWEGKCQGSLFMNSSGNYCLTLEGNRAYLDANVPYATSAESATSATSATYSTYTGTQWTAVAQGLKWRRICYVATDIGTVGTSGILNIRATRGNFVVNASFMVCSSHSKQCSIVQLSSTSYSTVQIRGVVDSSGNFYIELYDDQVSIASGTNQYYYCSWIPLTQNSITCYTSAVSGSTVPDGFAVSSSYRTAPGPYVVGNFVTHNWGGTLPSSAPVGAIFFKT